MILHYDMYTKHFYIIAEITVSKHLVQMSVKKV